MKKRDDLKIAGLDMWNPNHGRTPGDQNIKLPIPPKPNLPLPPPPKKASKKRKPKTRTA